MGVAAGRTPILISAGEASGEMYGARLIEALKRHEPSLQFFGVGGERMRAAGCDTVVDARDLAVVGISEIVGHLPKIYSRFRTLVAAIDQRRPALGIVIDSPAFNWRVARQLKQRSVPVVYYVTPQFWAWRQGRVRLLKKYVDKLLVIFPFEEGFFRERGMDAQFVGHPLADIAPPAPDREAFASEHKLDPAKNWITLMPGSRRKEVRMNLPTIIEAVQRLGSGYEYVLPVAPTLDHAFVQEFIGSQSIALVADSLPALVLSRAAIVASGTATVEAALMGTPFVMVYRVSPITFALGRPLVKVPHFAMVNLIAGERVVSELVQDDFTAENVVSAMQPLLKERPERAKMLAGLEKVRALLKGANPSDNRSAAERAAEIIVGMLQKAQNFQVQTPDAGTSVR